VARITECCASKSFRRGSGLQPIRSTQEIHPIVAHRKIPSQSPLKFNNTLR
jgi:hypothetical protein